MLPLGHPWVPSTNFRPFGPAVWSDIANRQIYMSEENYYIYRYIAGRHNCIYVGVYERVYVCMYVWVGACMYVCMLPI